MKILYPDYFKWLFQIIRPTFRSSGTIADTQPRPSSYTRFSTFLMRRSFSGNIRVQFRGMFLYMEIFLCL